MTIETRDTIDALMARYVAGSLPLPAQVLVNAHLAIKPENRRLVRSLEAVAGAQLDALVPVPLAHVDQRLGEILAMPAAVSAAPVSHDDAIFPTVLRDFIGYDAAAVPWRTKLPGFREFDLGDIDGCHTSLFWIRAGRRIPAHTHEGEEISLVLDGAFNDSTGRYGRGDISLTDETIDHRPTAEKDRPCIGFAVVSGKLKLTGPFYQRIADILGT